MEFNRIVVWCLATGRQLSEAVETKDILESLMSSWIFFFKFFFLAFLLLEIPCSSLSTKGFLLTVKISSQYLLLHTLKLSFPLIPSQATGVEEIDYCQEWLRLIQLCFVVILQCMSGISSRQFAIRATHHAKR